MNDPPLPDLEFKFGHLFIKRIVEDTNFTNPALCRIESNRQVGHTVFVNPAQSGFACRVTATSRASSHPFEVTVKTVKRNIDHEDMEPERSRKFGLLERDEAPQRRFQGE